MNSNMCADGSQKSVLEENKKKGAKENKKDKRRRKRPKGGSRDVGFFERPRVMRFSLLKGETRRRAGTPHPPKSYIIPVHSSSPVCVLCCVLCSVLMVDRAGLFSSTH